MERTQEERIVTYVLRIVGVVTVFVGLIFVGQGIIQAIAQVVAKNSMMMPQTELFQNNAGIFSILWIVSKAIVVGWGGLCYILAKPLSKRITQ